MSQDLTKAQKLIAISAVIIIAGFALKDRFSLADEQQDSAGSEEKKLAELLIEGDADSPVDMLRRLNENARKAVETAQSADTKVQDYEVSTAQKIDSLLGSITADQEKSKGEINANIGDLKNEFNNFKQLMAGKLQAETGSQRSTATMLGNNAWSEIPPINQLASVNQYPREFNNGSSQDAYAINDGFLLTQTNTDNPQGSLITPVATIPENSPLLHSVTLSTLIGRVPKQGQVFEPFNFFVQTGSENWTSQDHEIPFLERAIWRGIATGDKDLECIRGSLMSVTFVFTDSTIQTVTATTESPLAELVTKTGSNCIPGEYVSNTGKYLTYYGLGGALSGLGEGIAGNESITSFNSDGSLFSAVNGSTANFLAGKALSSSANKASEIIDEEYDSSFSSVILQAGVDINMMALKQINIDHDKAGRKVSYVD